MADNKENRYTGILLWVTSIMAAFMLFAAVLVRRRRVREARMRVLQEQEERLLRPVHEHIRGLTKAEAAARRQEGLDNAITTRPDRSLKEIIRENTFSIFNLSLLGIAVVQILIGKPLDVLLSLGVMVLNIALNTAQELIARKRMQEVEQSNLPKTTVIREGKAYSVDPDEVVVGDMLVVGPGDQLFVDGEMIGDGDIVVDESFFNPKNRCIKKYTGDSVYGGSYCVSGRGVYQVSKVGEKRRITKLMIDDNEVEEELTPLEKIIDRVLKIMLAIVGILIFVFLTMYFKIDLGIPSATVIDAASVIFSIAPAGLFFMILLTYTAGSADLVKIGALVRRARSVEKLAQVNAMCFSKAGVLTGTQVELKFIEQPEDSDPLAETRIRQILGDYANSVSIRSLSTDVIAQSYEGNQRLVVDEAPFMSIYGWSAIAFTDDDLSGVYVLAAPQFLEGLLEKDDDKDSPTEQEEAQQPAWRKTFGRLGGIFKRANGRSVEPETGTDEQELAPEVENLSGEEDGGQNVDSPPDAEQISKPNIFRRIAGRVNGLMRREETAEQEQDTAEKIIGEEVELVFAYSPEIQSLMDADGTQILPEELIPLCSLRYSEQVNPDAVEILEKFSQDGVSVKVFSADAAEKSALMLQAAGWNAGENLTDVMISGSELDSLSREEYLQACVDNQFFGQLTPLQAGDVVDALRQSGLYVAVLGDGVNEVPAMRQADLTIAMHSSNQAARSVADIILLEDSPSVLQRVLDKGQRIVNGLMDVLKLYITQILYLTVLILAVQIVAYGFPYKSAQGGVISFLTITLPSLGLSLWASAGVLPGAKMRIILRRFTVPASITIAATAMMVYYYFLTSYGRVDYAQLAVTYTLVGTGLILVIFLKPPLRVQVGGARLRGDLRFTLLVCFALVLFGLLVTIPLSQELMKLDLLERPEDYLAILLALIWWTITLLLIWFIWPQDGRETRLWQFVRGRFAKR